MITEKEEYNKFIKAESYHVPFDTKSMDGAAVIAALLVLKELKSQSFGISTECGFEGVVLKTDIEAIENQLFKKACDLGIDQYLK